MSPKSAVASSIGGPAGRRSDPLQLVTGGCGYFGSVLVRELLARGSRMRIFDLDDAPDRPPETDFVRGDIRDPLAVRQACRGVATVYHNVATVPIAKDRKTFWSVNRDGTSNLLEEALAAGVQKVVHTSSSAVFGVPPRCPIDDEVEPRPREAYGRAKLAAEHLCRRFVERGLDVTILRPRTVMGHGRLGIMQIIFEWVREGRNVPVLGSGDNRYQFIHADDLARACLLAARRPGFAVYNVGAEDFCSMRETLEGLIAHAATGSRVRSLPLAPAVAAMRLAGWLGLSPLGPYHALAYGRSIYFDIARAKAELGWAPVFGNVEMFCQSYDWYLANRESVLASTGRSHHRSALRQGILGLVKRLL